MTDRRVRLRDPSALRSARFSSLVSAITVHGELDEAGASDLRDEILRAVDGGVAAITVDLGDAVLRSRGAVEVLALAAELMRNRGAVLVVVARGGDGRSVVVAGAEGAARLESVLGLRHGAVSLPGAGASDLA